MPATKLKEFLDAHQVKYRIHGWELAKTTIQFADFQRLVEPTIGAFFRR